MVSVFKTPNNKVALGLAFSGPNIGGVRRYIENIKEKSSYQITLFPDYNIDELSKQTKDINIRNEYRHEIIKNEQKIIDNHDIFHSNVDPTFIRLCVKAQQQGKKWIHTYHSFYKENYEPNKKLQNWQKEINETLFTIANKADIRVSVSEWLVNYLEIIGIKSLFIPNFVDVDNIDKFNTSNIRKNFILFIGDNSDKKNHKELLSVAKDCRQYDFVFIGTGLTKEYLGEFDNIHAMGALPHNLCMKYLAECSILVINSFTEGLPTVLLEAMTLAKPCIIPDGPEWSASFFQNKEGYKYQLGNILDLKNQIISIMSNYRSMSQAREYVLQNFTSDIIVKQIDNLYWGLLNE